MTELFSYIAARGYVPDGFVDDVVMPEGMRAIRFVARPNVHNPTAVAGDLLRAMGLTRGYTTHPIGHTDTLTMALAWGLAYRVSDVFIAEAQDMKPRHVPYLCEYAERVGAKLHLVYHHSLLHRHRSVLASCQAQHRPFGALPANIRKPRNRVVEVSSPIQTPIDQTTGKPLVTPEEEWPAFRTTYLDTLLPEHRAYADVIYLDAYYAARKSSATSTDGLISLIAAQWKRHGVDEFERTVAVRAIQAAMIRNGVAVQVALPRLHKHIVRHHFNPLLPVHYRELARFGDPLRSAAAIMHAHHVPEERMLSLRTDEVTRGGQIRGGGVRFPPLAATVVAAQRWRRILSDPDNPSFFDRNSAELRNGIRRIAGDAQLPIICEWRIARSRKWEQIRGINTVSIL